MEEWKKVRLGDCIQEINERTIQNNQYEVLTSSKSGIYSQEEYFDKQVASKDNTGYKIIRKGQFTYRSMSDNGIFTINRLENKEIGIVSPAYPVFEAIKINPIYLKYYFESELFRKAIHNLSQGSTRTALKYKDLTDIELFLPPIEEQEKILKILNIFDCILNSIDIMTDNENKRKSYYMNQFFEKSIDTGKKMKDFCCFFSGGTPSSKNKKYYNGNIPFIRSAEINSNCTELTINEEGLNNSSAKIVNKGDLLMALYGANSGNVAISKMCGAINQAILCIRSEKVNIEYLKYILEYDQMRIIKLYLQGGQGNLSAEIVKNLNYSFPDKKIQNKRVEILKLLDNKIEMYKSINEKYKMLKKALMQKLLTGKVRIKI